MTSLCACMQDLGVGGADTPTDAWNLEPSDSESDQEEEPENMGMETGRLSNLNPLELVLKAIQNVKEDDNMVKTS